MPLTTEEDCLESLVLLQGLLAEVADWLAPDRPEGADPARLAPLLAQAHERSAHARLPGLVELLQIWSAAFAHRARLAAQLDDDEKDLGHVWFFVAQTYCRGELDDDGQAELLELLALMPKLAPLPARLSAYLAQQLHATRERIRTLLAMLSVTAPIAPTLADSAPIAAVWNGAIGDEALLEEALFEQAPFDEPWVFAEIAPSARDVDANAVPAITDPVPPEPRPEPAAHNRGELLFNDVDDTITLAAAVAPAAPVDNAIWISTDELQLALDAIGSQVLPSIFALADASDGDAEQSARDDLGFHLGLVGNAMELLGVPSLSAGIEHVQSSLDADAAPDAAWLTGWASALMAFLETPDTDTAAFLAEAGHGVAGLDAAWALALHDEAARVRVGQDPAALALRKVSVQADDIALDISSDVLPNVLEGMLRELPGNAERLGTAVRRWLATGDAGALDEARRVAHTLKGDANTVGIRGLANLTHSLEDLLTDVQGQGGSLPQGLAAVVDRAADSVEEIADHLLGRGPLPSDLAGVYQSVLDWANALADGSVPDGMAMAPASNDIVIDRMPVTPAAAALPSTTTANESAPADAERTGTLTVSVPLLDELQRLSGESLVMARQIDQRLSVLDGLHREQAIESRNASTLMSRLDDLITIRGAALQSTALRAGSDVDPLELDQYNELHVVSRRLLESSADGNEHRRRMDALLVEFDSLRSDQEAVHADLQRLVQRTRTVPFDQIGARIQRIVRQTARQLGREVDLHVTGQETLIDADLLDRVVEPLAHLLRNAIDHGIEDETERLACGKPAVGSIRMAISTVADSIEIRIEDDGRGLDLDRIRTKAIALGLLDSDQASSEDELLRAVLAPGFTTRDQATQVSGRGIGMDVVNQRVLALRGRLSLDSVRGQGLRVTLRLPVSQTMANVLVAHGQGLILGAIAGSVERVEHFGAGELAIDAQGRASLMIDGSPVEVSALESLYGRSLDRQRSVDTGGIGLLVRSTRGKRMLVRVDRISEVSNVIVKPISPFLPPVPSVRGMTVLGDGSVAAVVDMGTLVDLVDAGDSPRASNHPADAIALPRAVVADDSLSVRRALAQLMEDAGFEVTTARDGLEALELIQAQTPDLVLLDLEMPRLNGLEVTRFMRGRDATRHVPVLMITSRASAKYQAQAHEAGVTSMLGKPVSEDDLMAAVRGAMAEPAAIAALERS